MRGLGVEATGKWEEKCYVKMNGMCFIGESAAILIPIIVINYSYFNR